MKRRQALIRLNTSVAVSRLSPVVRDRTQGVSPVCPSRFSSEEFGFSNVCLFRVYVYVCACVCVYVCACTCVFVFILNYRSRTDRTFTYLVDPNVYLDQYKRKRSSLTPIPLAQIVSRLYRILPVTPLEDSIDRNFTHLEGRLRDAH